MHIQAGKIVRDPGRGRCVFNGDLILSFLLDVQECIDKFDTETEEKNRASLLKEMQNLLDKAKFWLGDPDFCIYYLGDRKSNVAEAMLSLEKRLRGIKGGNRSA